MSSSEKQDLFLASSHLVHPLGKSDLTGRPEPRIPGEGYPLSLISKVRLMEVLSSARGLGRRGVGNL